MVNYTVTFNHFIRLAGAPSSTLHTSPGFSALPPICPTLPEPTLQICLSDDRGTQSAPAITFAKKNVQAPRVVEYPSRGAGPMDVLSRSLMRRQSDAEAKLSWGFQSHALLSWKIFFPERPIRYSNVSR